jgi:hypothetical protein
MNLIKPILLASAFVVSTPASATEYLFDIGIGGSTGSGSFTTQGDASVGFALVESLTGTFGGSSMTLLAPGTYPFAAGEQNDNLFTSTFPHFSFRGLSFAAGGSNYNIWNYQGSLNACSSNASCFQSASFSVSEVGAAVPEPLTWAMMLLGFGFVGGAMRSVRRRQKLTVSYA